MQRQLATLSEGGFVERGENLLAFGLPGRGKTHVVCAIGHELIQRGYRVLFTPTYALVQRLLAAKRDLRLEKELVALDAFDAVILDDIGYVQQSREEMEVLFTFLSERYERKTVIITSNLLFSEWDRIFKDLMTTAAAIDRLVHHAVILEMTGPSIRNEEAEGRGDPGDDDLGGHGDDLEQDLSARGRWGDVIVVGEEKGEEQERWDRRQLPRRRSRRSSRWAGGRWGDVIVVGEEETKNRSGDPATTTRQRSRRSSR